MHTLITGRTEMGKTTLARILHNQLKANGNKTAAYSTQKWEWKQADFSTNDGNELLRYLREPENNESFVFVDESADSVDKYDEQYKWLAGSSRHYGHSVTFIAHLLTDVNPSIRMNCKRWILFASRRRDFELAESEYDVKLASRQLADGEFLLFDPGKPPRKGKVNFSKQSLTWISDGGNH